MSGSTWAGRGHLVVAYMPILKGRDAEFTAVGHLSQAVLADILPVFEVAPGTDGPAKAASKFGKRVLDWLPRNLTIAVDVRYLSHPANGPRGPMRGIAEEFQVQQVPMLPVVRLLDSEHHLADVGYAADLHDGQAVLRLGGDTRDPDDDEAEEHLHRLTDHTGLQVEQCHLLLDVFDIRSDRDLSRVEPVVRKCVSWAQRYPWRSITLAAGAMPESISHLPTHAPEPLPRRDHQFWERVRDLDVKYSDYAIAHPQMTGPGWAPMPSLRYTDDEHWWIYRWQQDKLARPAMYDLCQALVTSDHWDPDRPNLSWGDEQIAARAAGRCGPGNPTSWRAWGTSHHLAHVTRQLTQP